MADEADLGNEQAQRILDAQLAAARAAHPAIPEVVTACLNCGDPPMAGAKYCSPECCSDHSERMRVRRAQGAM